MSAVDILLPVRDASGTVGECLESVRSQTHDEFRCLVLDDGSTDASAEIVLERVGDDHRFELHRLPGRGLVPTLNDGLSFVTAPFVARIDADDRMLPSRLESQLKMFESDASVDIVSSRVHFFGRRVSSNLRVYEAWLNSLVTHEEIVRDLFVESPIPHPSATLKTTAFRTLKGYRETKGPEDYDLWLRAWRSGMRFAKAPEALVEIRDHASRLTKTDRRYTARAFVECKAEHLVNGLGWAGRRVVVWGAGRDGKRMAQALRRRGVELAGFVDVAPTKIGRSLLGVDVRSFDALRSGSDCPVIVAVGTRGARAEIRGHLQSFGYVEGDDFICVA